MKLLSTRTLGGLGLPLLAGVVASGASQEAPAPAAESSRPRIYSCDPAHPWDRVHRALWVRTGPDGKEYGLDELDPLLWPQSRYLLEEPAHSRALAALDAFLARDGDRLLPDPLKRVAFQRDLWAIFDWLASVSGEGGPRAAELARRIARAMRRGALAPEEIRALPDNYAAAVASGSFPTQPTSGGRSEPFLPADLLRPDGTWVRLRTQAWEPLAPFHADVFEGRSVFSVCLRLPGGRAETLEYLAKLRAFPNPVVGDGDGRRLNPDLPQFPPGTAVALVRRMVAVDDRGELVPTPITESVQLRLYRSTANPAPNFGCCVDLFPIQVVFEFVLSRERLFTGVAGGLRAIGREEKGFGFRRSKLGDPFEGPSELFSAAPVLWQCGSCHAQPGIYSVNSYTRISTGPGTIFDVEARENPWRLHPVEPRVPDGYAFAWKAGRASFGYLRGLWAALPR